MRRIHAFRAILIVGTLCAFPSLCTHAAATNAAHSAVAQDNRAPYIGTWQREINDSTGDTKITLQLRGDGSYTKNMDAVLRGREFHGSENGSWSADGPVVRCSGDGNYPVSTHDLRYYKKLQ